jgi:hypothetical protein
MQQFTDRHGRVAVAGMKARHGGDDGESFTGTIETYRVFIGERLEDETLVFVYDDKPRNQDERPFTFLDMIDDLEILG